MSRLDARRNKKTLRAADSAIEEAAERRDHFLAESYVELSSKETEENADDVRAIYVGQLSAYSFLSYLPAYAFANAKDVKPLVIDELVKLATDDDVFRKAFPLATTAFVAYNSANRIPAEYDERMERLAKVYPYLLSEGKDISDYGLYVSRKKNEPLPFYTRSSRLICEQITPEHSKELAVFFIMESSLWLDAWFRAMDEVHKHLNPG